MCCSWFLRKNNDCFMSHVKKARFKFQITRWPSSIMMHHSGFHRRPVEITWNYHIWSCMIICGYLVFIANHQKTAYCEDSPTICRWDPLTFNAKTTKTLEIKAMIPDLDPAGVEIEDPMAPCHSNHQEVSRYHFVTPNEQPNWFGFWMDQTY